MEKLKTVLDVHIVPVGLEIDRAVIPLKVHNADKVYLLTQEKENGASKYFLREIQERIDKECPRLKGNVIIRRYREWDDLSSIMSEICRIVRYEKSEGNRIFINISSGGKLAGIAGTIISLMYGVTAYYVIPEVYKDRMEKKQPTTGYRETLELPRFKIENPDDKLVYVLWLINKYGRTTQKRIIADPVIQKLMEIPDEKENKLSNHAVYGKFWRNFLQPLVKKGWIEKEGQRRAAKISLTKEGENILKIFGPSNKFIQPEGPPSANEVSDA